MKDYTFKVTKTEYITVTADDLDLAYDALEDNYDIEDAEVHLYEVGNDYK